VSPSICKSYDFSKIDQTAFKNQHSSLTTVNNKTKLVFNFSLAMKKVAVLVLYTADASLEVSILGTHKRKNNFISLPLHLSLWEVTHPSLARVAFENFKQDKWMCPAAIGGANFLPSTSGKKPLSAHTPKQKAARGSLASSGSRRESDLCWSRSPNMRTSVCSANVNRSGGVAAAAPRYLMVSIAASGGALRVNKMAKIKSFASRFQITFMQSIFI
jgi:hypothetical protein